MKLAECRSAYQQLSGKASDLARTLSLSGIAIIWVFKSNTSTGPEIPQELFRPGVFVVLSLALDLLQYVSSAVAWGVYGRVRELRGTTVEEEFKAPRWLNWPGILTFYGKILCVALAYYYLLQYLIARFV
jgi:hypothetical protein